MMIKNIIFDFGGVILKHKATITTAILSTIFPSSKNKIEKAWNHYKIPLNTGKKTSEELILELKKDTNTQSSVSDIKQKWLELYGKDTDRVDWELLGCIEKLNENYKVYLFTDTIDIHDEYNKTRNIYDKFHQVYKSFEEGVAKVEGKKACLHVLEKIKTRPEECVFIDDLEANVKVAKALGIKGILYINNEDLKSKLAQERVNV